MLSSDDKNYLRSKVTEAIALASREAAPLKNGASVTVPVLIPADDAEFFSLKHCSIELQKHEDGFKFAGRVSEVIKNGVGAVVDVIHYDLSKTE